MSDILLDWTRSYVCEFQVVFTTLSETEKENDMNLFNFN